jgi:tripartite-type tricarboxylate transporter receptor subunit TctC
MLHVPFKGLSPMLTELLADRVDMSIAPLPGLIGQQIATGAVRALAVARAQRLSQLASVPTFVESGVPGVEADAWSALFAPARTPPAVIERLYRAVTAVLAKDAMRAAMAKQGIPADLKSPAEVAAMLPGEIAKWAVVIKMANLAE